MVDNEMRRRMALVIPHVRRAYLIGKTINLGQSEAACFSDILDGLSAGMILVDGIGRVVHANAAGNAILRAADFLRTVHGRLVAGDASTNASFREILVAADAGDAAIGVRGVALPLTAHDGERYVAHVLPLTSGVRRQAGLAFNAVAALFIRKAALEASATPDVIGRMYKLTPPNCACCLPLSMSAESRRWRRRLAWLPPPSRPTSIACLKKPASADRPIWSSWWPGFPRHWPADANHSSNRTKNRAGRWRGSPPLRCGG